MKEIRLLNILTIIITSMITTGCLQKNAKKIVFPTGKTIRYQIKGQKSAVIQTALSLFDRDLNVVLQAKLEMDSQLPQIIFQTLSTNSQDPLACKPQGFRIEEKKGKLYVTGADI